VKRKELITTRSGASLGMPAASSAWVISIMSYDRGFWNRFG